MIKKTITYQNYNDETVTKDFYFNLSTAEVIRKDAEENLQGGYRALLQRISESNDGKQLLPAFEDFVKESYGVRSADGSEFLKTEDAFEHFKGSGAFDSLFLEFLTNADFASEFVRGVMPSQAALAKAAENVANGQSGPRQPQDHLPSARETFAQQQANSSAYPQLARHEGLNTQSQPTEDEDEDEGEPRMRTMKEQLAFDRESGLSNLQLAEKHDLKPSEVRDILDS